MKGLEAAVGESAIGEGTIGDAGERSQSELNGPDIDSVARTDLTSRTTPPKPHRCQSPRPFRTSTRDH